MNNYLAFVSFVNGLSAIGNFKTVKQFVYRDGNEWESCCIYVDDTVTGVHYVFDYLIGSFIEGFSLHSFEGEHIFAKGSNTRQYYCKKYEDALNILFNA